MKDKEIFEGEDLDGNIVKFTIKTPGAEEIKKSQVVYNKAFKDALDDGALLRQKLNSYMRDQNLWDDDKQKQYDDLVEKISELEELLQAGGIRLTSAKEVALDLRKNREKFRSLIAERNSLDAASAEGQADNARFEELVRLCTINPETKNLWFSSKADYNASSGQPWVVVAAEKLGNAMYGLDPNYEKNLEENKFLKEFNFVDEELRLINDEGHLTDADGRLINEEGRFIAYRTEKGKKEKDPDQVYFVNREGEEVVLVTNKDGDEEWVKLSLKERKPFLDEQDKPIAEKSEEKPKPKTRRKTTAKKTDAKST